MRDRVIEREHLLVMRLRRRKPTGEHHDSGLGSVTQNEPGQIIPLPAQDAANSSFNALRQIEFAAAGKITNPSMGKPKELRGGAQLLPQLLCARIGLARFRCRSTP